ncbi:uncharacterized protein LOC107980838 [Nasonia vitripennis]|uniref:Uncharacterized protein n=1 Tax=Nasonia vitripennis TaxID=7425 RepID=A0A7M7INF9_NASVI|nr:uncharacterized protein LOC107980838 [Nasonia vitripennis]
MAILTRLVCLVFLYFFLETSNAEGRVAFKENWNITGWITYSEFYAIENYYYDLTYVNCGEYFEGPEHNCTAVVQGPQSEMSCPFTPRTYDARIMRIYPLGSTRLVILWIQHLRTKVDPNRETLYMCTILDLTTCQSKELVIPSARSIMASVFFTSYNDSFDIAILCDNDRYCKYNIDVDGNITSSGISKSELRLYYDASRTERTTLRAIESSTDKRLKLYLQNRYDGTLRSKLRKPDGSWQMLAPFYKNSGVFKFDSLNSEDDEYLMNVMSDSTAHGRISIAAAIHTRAKVWQFDQEGNLKLKALIEHEFFVSYVRVLNTADGGLFLLSMDTGNSRLEKIYNKNYKKYYLTKVAADGNITGTIQNAADPDVNLSRRTQVQLFENDANEYCVNFQNTAHFYLRSNVRERSSEGVRLVMCFKDSEFFVDKNYFI